MMRTDDNDTAAICSKLSKSLAEHHNDLSGWIGVPDGQFLAKALSNVMDRYADLAFGNSPNAGSNFFAILLNGPDDTVGLRMQAAKDIALMDAVINALRARDADGWKLHLTGRKGKKSGPVLTPSGI